MGRWQKILIVLLFASTSFTALANSNPKWIWFPDPPGVKGETRYFRTILELDELPVSALARIVANQEVRVFLNGEEIGFIRPDEILGSVELADYLKEGKNVLGIRIQASEENEIQPLLVRVVDIDDEIILSTDESWVSASQEIEGWSTLSCDVSNWAQVLVSENREKPDISGMEMIMLMGQFAPEVDPLILDNALVWATHSLEYVFTDDQKKEEEKITALTGRNQFASSQIAIRSAKEILALELEFSDLLHEEGDHTIDKSQFYYNFIDTWYMPKNSTDTPVKELIRIAPEQMPDILVESPIANIPSDYTKAIYLRFFIPRDTFPGIYTGSVILKTIGATREVPVEIEVLPIDLPSETNLKVTIWFQPDYIVQYNNVSKYSEEFWEILKDYASLMSAHRQNMVWTPLGMIELRYNAQGELEGDFTTFDRWIEIFFDHGFKYIELSHIGGRTGDWGSPFAYWKRQAYDPTQKIAKEVPLSDYMNLIQEHLREKGWLERAYAHVADEPIPANYRSWIDLALEVKKGAPELKIMEALHYTDLSDYLDVAIPQLDYFDINKARLMKEQENGDVELWFYTCWLPQGNYPNRLLDYPLYKTRILHWANFIYDTKGYLHWGYNWWRAFEVGYAPGDGWIVYPTAKGLTPALRYEAMREGLEDYEYFLMHANKMRLLAEELGAPLKGDERAKEIARSVMPSLTRYTKDPIEMLGAREKLLRELADFDKGPKAILITDVLEDRVNREEFETNLEIYTEEGAIVYLNGVLLKANANGYYTETVLVTPTENKLVVTVIKDEESKRLERVYNNWRIIR